MDTRTLNPAYFGQGVTLADIEKLTLSAADLDRLTLGKADLADLAPPPLCWRHEPQGVAIGLPQLSQDPQGSPVEKGIEFLRPYSLVEIAAILSGLADGAPVDEYELLRRAQLDLLSLPPGRPRIYDDSRSLAEMARLMAEDESLSVNRAATLVAERLTGEHSANSARDRLAKNYRRGQRRIAAAQKSPGQNADLSLMRPADEAVI
jgi:hypothetical protein